MRMQIVTVMFSVLAGVGLGFGMARLFPITPDQTSAPAGPAVAETASSAASNPATRGDGPGRKEERKAGAAANPQGTMAGPKAARPPAAMDTVARESEARPPSPAERQSQQRETGLLDNWIALDPASAAAWAADIFARGGGDQLLRQAVRGYARHNPRAAAAWASSLASPLVRDSALREVFETWASADPWSAAAEVSSLPPGSAQSTAANVVANHFARLDFEGALAWMGSLAVPVQGGVLPVIMRAQWARTGSKNPGAALPWLLAQPAATLREQGIRFVVGEWAKRDPLAALAQAAFISDRIDRSIFYDTAMVTYIATNPREATLWLASQPASGETEGFMRRALAAWAAFEPRPSANWAAAREDAILRNRNIATVAETWARVDPDGLAEWLRNLPDAATRDAALASAVRVWMHRDPAAAANWAAGIADAGQRQQSLTQIVSTWKTHDNAAALAFVRTTPLVDDQLRGKLLR